ncbi:enoyl-(Acyl carrier protein) reductase domain-containing protein [Sarocladium implicatum]|nr:enoyl-(Acyl carrier protein) reductase domain-containing protein [Sarocladium implicatum]
MSTDSLSLANKVAIVTGSGRENGIGAAIALALAKAGALVTVNYVSEASASRAAQVVSNIEAAAGKGVATSVGADVSTPEGSKKIVDETLSAFGVDHIDIVVNNASYMVGGGALQTSLGDMMKSYEVAVVGPVLLLQAAYSHMPQHGRVINIGSVASKMGFYQMGIYGAVKAAMDQLTWTLAQELGRDGKNITVNTVAPGPTLTDTLPPVPEVEPMKDFLLSRTRGGDRVTAVEDVADAVLLLASEKSRWITGQFISASGGINGG